MNLFALLAPVLLVAVGVIVIVYARRQLRGRSTNALPARVRLDLPGRLGRDRKGEELGGGDGGADGARDGGA